MKIFLSGIGLVAIALLIGYVTKDWTLMDAWMLRIGGIGCVIAILFAGGIARGGRIGGGTDTDRVERGNFYRFCGFLFSFSVPCLIVGAVIFYSTH